MLLAPRAIQDGLGFYFRIDPHHCTGPQGAITEVTGPACHLTAKGTQISSLRFASAYFGLNSVVWASLRSIGFSLIGI